MQQLFINKDKNYFLVCSEDDMEVYCSHCKKIIPQKHYIFIHKSYSKKEYVKEFYCQHCIRYHKKRIYDEFISAEIINFIPDKSSIVPDFAPSLKDSRMSNIFTIKEIERDIKKGIGHTNLCRHAFNPDRNKMENFKKYDLLSAEQEEEKRRRHIKNHAEFDKNLGLLSSAESIPKQHLVNGKEVPRLN